MRSQEKWSGPGGSGPAGGCVRVQDKGGSGPGGSGPGGRLFCFPKNGTKHTHVELSGHLVKPHEKPEKIE